MKKHARRIAAVLLAVVMVVLTAAPVFAVPDDREPRKPGRPVAPPEATPPASPPGTTPRDEHAIDEGGGGQGVGTVPAANKPAQGGL